MVATAFWVAYIKGWIFAPFESISATEALALIKENRYPIIDIRDTQAYKKGHIRNAISVPYNQLEAKLSILKPYKESKIIICSATGQKGIEISRYLAKKGFHPINIKSGLLGLAIVGKKEPNLFISNLIK